jgi:fumarate hydratase class II
MLEDDLRQIEDALKVVCRLALGGTAVGRGINAAPEFGEAAAAEIAGLKSAARQRTQLIRRAGAHDDLVVTGVDHL